MSNLSDIIDYLNQPTNPYKGRSFYNMPGVPSSTANGGFPVYGSMANTPNPMAGSPTGGNTYVGDNWWKSANIPSVSPPPQTTVRPPPRGGTQMPNIPPRQNPPPTQNPNQPPTTQSNPMWDSLNKFFSGGAVDRNGQRYQDPGYFNGLPPYPGGTPGAQSF